MTNLSLTFMNRSTAWIAEQEQTYSKIVQAHKRRRAIAKGKIAWHAALLRPVDYQRQRAFILQCGVTDNYMSAQQYAKAFGYREV